MIGSWDAANGADLDHRWPRRGRIRHTPFPSIRRPSCREARGLDRRNHFDFRRVGRVGMIQLQVDKTVIADIQDPEPVGPGLHSGGEVGGAVDHGRVQEGFGHNRCGGNHSTVPIRGRRKEAIPTIPGFAAVNQAWADALLPGDIPFDTCTGRSGRASAIRSRPCSAK